MSMRRAVIINYKVFLVHMIEVENLILSSLKFYLLSLTKSPWCNLKVKRAQN